MFNDKKSIYFLCQTKNSYWEILTKNSITCKRKDGAKDEKLYYFGASLKNLTFREWGKGVTKNQCRRGLPKKGWGLESLPF